MGFVVDFDARNKVLRVTLEGRVTDEIMLDAYATVAKYAASRGPCRGITNVLPVTKFEVSSNAIRQMASSTPAFPIGYMRILVAPSDYIFGMARMFQMLGDRTRPDLQIVRTLDEAYRLLQIDSPEFTPVS